MANGENPTPQKVEGVYRPGNDDPRPEVRKAAKKRRGHDFVEGRFKDYDGRPYSAGTIFPEEQ